MVTSYDGEEPGLSDGFTGEQLTEAEYKYRMNRAMRGDKSPEEFEEWAKKEFIDHPATMKLLIVVDKLLTGFDAPPASYLYIDKKMVDHNLFQAICRVNRLNGERKRYGYIIDYKHLFESIKGAVADYTGGAFENFEREDVEGLLKGRLEEGRKALEAALERCDILSEPVLPLNAQRHPLCEPIRVARGTANSSGIMPRDVFREAIRWNAHCILVAHNHPNGDPAPSEGDIETTRALMSLSKDLGVPLIDHLVIADSGYVSIREALRGHASRIP